MTGSGCRSRIRVRAGGRMRVYRTGGRTAGAVVPLAVVTTLVFGGGTAYAADRASGTRASNKHAVVAAAPVVRTAQEASAAAVASRQPVAVDTEGDEYEDVVANPDGSFTSTTTAGAHRAKVGGQWQPVDTT